MEGITRIRGGKASNSMAIIRATFRWKLRAMVHLGIRSANDVVYSMPTIKIRADLPVRHQEKMIVPCLGSYIRGAAYLIQKQCAT